jgi:hypothetical protein
MKHQGELGHLKHMLKRPMSDNERNVLTGEIESKTKEVKHHLNKLHQGILEEK